MARDHKFLEPELDGLFSPVSNSLSTNMLADLVQFCGRKINLYSAASGMPIQKFPREGKSM